MSFSSLGLPEPILQGVYASGYGTPTEIQQKSIPAALAGRDILGCAPTGTGKTAAFVLPILSHLLKIPQNSYKNGSPRALILTPTRELAQQIEDSIFGYGSYTDFRPLSVYGGVSYKNQLRELKNGVDIIVATPGRLLDHLNNRTISLSQVEILVLDEADRMYDMGFIHDVRTIASRVPSNRQTLLFSATMSSDIRSLVSELQRSPLYVEIGAPNSPADLVDQQFYYVPKEAKLNLLVHILKNYAVETMLVFSKTKIGADRINRRLQKESINSSTIHADRSQAQRQQALDGFKRRKFKVLVATDLAARGIDIDKIACVVNYDTPEFAEDYIHRIGRTGRAESSGIAITFVSEDEKKNMKRIEFLTGKQFRLREFPGFQLPEEKTPEVETPSYLQRKRKYYRKPSFAFR